jgi:hypothetical protein
LLRESIVVLLEQLTLDAEEAVLVMMMAVVDEDVVVDEYHSQTNEAVNRHHTTMFYK